MDVEQSSEAGSDVAVGNVEARARDRQEELTDLGGRRRRRPASACRLRRRRRELDGVSDRRDRDARRPVSGRQRVVARRQLDQVLGRLLDRRHTPVRVGPARVELDDAREQAQEVPRERQGRRGVHAPRERIQDAELRVGDVAGVEVPPAEVRDVGDAEPSSRPALPVPAVELGGEAEAGRGHQLEGPAVHDATGEVEVEVGHRDDHDLAVDICAVWGHEVVRRGWRGWGKDASETRGGPTIIPLRCLSLSP